MAVENALIDLTLWRRSFVLALERVLNSADKKCWSPTSVSMIGWWRSEYPNNVGGMIILHRPFAPSIRIRNKIYKKRTFSRRAWQRIGPAPRTQSADYAFWLGKQTTEITTTIKDWKMESSTLLNEFNQSTGKLSAFILVPLDLRLRWRARACEFSRTIIFSTRV